MFTTKARGFPGPVQKARHNPGWASKKYGGTLNLPRSSSLIAIVSNVKSRKRPSFDVWMLMHPISWSLVFAFAVGVMYLFVLPPIFGMAIAFNVNALTWGVALSSMMGLSQFLGIHYRLRKMTQRRSKQLT